MSLPGITTQEEWLEARERLLAKESELLQTRDDLTAERRQLPMVKIVKDYVFEGPNGNVGLLDLFDGRRQLIVYHFWFPEGEQPCEGCTLWLNNVGDVASLHAGDTSLVLVSRARSTELEEAKKRKGWTLPWFSAVGEEFLEDVGYTDDAQLTVFLRDGDAVYRTYATSGRVLTTLGNHWTLLDLTPLAPSRG